jgi:hypothetical protein
VVGDALGMVARRHRHTLVEAAALVAALVERDGLVLVHPYDDPAVMAGQGTIGGRNAHPAGVVGDALGMVARRHRHHAAAALVGSAERIRGHVLRTPLVPAPRLSELTGARVLVKHENVVGDALGMVARRHRHHAAAALVGSELAQAVDGAALLEGAGGLP